MFLCIRLLLSTYLVCEFMKQPVIHTRLASSLDITAKQKPWHIQQPREPDCQQPLRNKEPSLCFAQERGC
jgi:hypothetical protein